MQLRRRNLVAGFALFLCLMLVSPPLILLAGEKRALAPDDFKVATETVAGLHSAIFETPNGTIKVNLPDDTAASDTITGSVYTEPEGKNEAEKQQNTGELSGYVVEIEKQKQPASEKRRKWLIPVTITGGAIAVVLRNKNGKEVAKTTLPCLPQPPNSSTDFQLPKNFQAGRPVEIMGRFDGDSDSTTVHVGDKNAEVLAESPRKCVALSPYSVQGPTEIEVTKKGEVKKGPCRSVAIALSATQTLLTKGQRATLTIKVLGLKGITEPVDVKLINASPTVIRVDSGDLQTFTIRPPEVLADGTYITNRGLTGVRAGGFNISAKVFY